MNRVTEQESNYKHIEKMSVLEVLQGINNEDKQVAFAVEKSLPQIAKLTTAVADKMKKGGRLFYIGAGTSGRLGVVDASECPPTYGVPFDWVVGIIAGGDTAIRKAVENAEDDVAQAWKDLQEFNINEKDCLVGLAASGTTPYVVGGLNIARQHGILTGCIVCNEGGPIVAGSDFPVEVVVGPEFITGSTRMKSGTAQKLVLNMLSTAVMVQLGRVVGNKMVDMQLTNHKLVDRGTLMIADELKINYEDAAELLSKYGSVRKAVEASKS
ncbi:N-acetylmuramic acid 6-phosphate etherase [Pedobacter changchengzhani]|uniref:N-acetylmuramic acid 6-phosphate etherase n=1 Tax=Pedobacter changchengzhani TaxID=2529274 RepID=A0A4R5MJ15_9SPHI|nr:N-acetylmuramic acid 6-phosphate etherase [Pedobacter changchengzhani]TDG35376.1 N-acetylmuramic acid 6-phosphate etherase [Pedobacter changchengzhani]